MNRLSELRKAYKLSQTELGKIIGVAQNTLSNWENGNREIDRESLFKLAEYFDVTTDFILGRDSENDFPEELIILNRNAKKMTPEERKQLLEMAKIMFKEKFDD